MNNPMNNFLPPIPTEDIELPQAVTRTKEQGGAKGVSERYQFFTTSDIVDILAGMGWRVVSATGRKTKKSSADVVRHQLVFRHPQYGTDYGYIPQIILVNSHDRTSSLDFHVGIFRLICSNGLVVCDRSFGRVNIRHINATELQVQEAIKGLMERIPEVYKKIDIMKAKVMTKKEQRVFALRALAERYHTSYYKGNKLDIRKLLKDFDLDTVLAPVREADTPDDVWTIYNRVQEKLVNGNFERSNRGEHNRTRRSRPIYEIRRAIKFNQNLWELAEEFAA
jgi:hypothetical protein